MYDDKGFVVNVMPVGSQSDVVAYQHLYDTNRTVRELETNVSHMSTAPYAPQLRYALNNRSERDTLNAHVRAKYVTPQLGAHNASMYLSQEQRINNLQGTLPWMVRQQDIFGYNATMSPEDVGLHRITSATPLVVSNRQPIDVDSRPMSAGVSSPLSLKRREYVFPDNKQ